MIMDYPDSIDCLGLILNSEFVEPAAWHMAVGTLLDFANDGKYILSRNCTYLLTMQYRKI